MKKLPVKYLVMFTVVIGLMIFTSVSSVRSALIYSDNYISDFEMYDIGITLQEKGDGEQDYKNVGWRNYKPVKDEKGNTLSGDWVVNKDIPLFASINDFVVGKQYSEQFRVLNSGTIDEYVRVKIYKYWLDGNNKKDTSLSPALIELRLVEGDNNWIIDDNNDPNRTTSERTVMYYAYPLKSSNNNNGQAETTPDFMTTLKINNSVMDAYDISTTEHVENGVTYKNTVYKFKYDGYTFCVEIEADAVQTHNAKDAIKSAWGRNVKIDKENGGKLSLVG